MFKRMGRNLVRRNKETYKFRCAARHPPLVSRPTAISRHFLVSTVTRTKPEGGCRTGPPCATLTAPAPTSPRRIDVVPTSIHGVPDKVQKAVLTVAGQIPLHDVPLLFPPPRLVGGTSFARE